MCRSFKHEVGAAAPSFVLRDQSAQKQTLQLPIEAKDQADAIFKIFSMGASEVEAPNKIMNTITGEKS